MRAWTYERYGEPDVMTFRDVPDPTPRAGELRVRVHATSLNASDMEFLRAKPAYIRLGAPFRPRVSILGSDVAGVVESVGAGVTAFAPGDAVCADLMGHGWGGLAERVRAPAERWVRKPDDVSFETAACVPQAGVVALQAIERVGRVRAGQRVAINGAGGGSGTFAIQLAKRLGAEVTAIDHGDKAALVRSLGADRVFDYTREDFTRAGPYDLVVDFVAHRSLFDHRRALARDGRYLVVGGSIPRLLQTVVVGRALSLFGRQRLSLLLHDQTPRDVATLLERCRTGEVVPHVGHRFPLAEADDAMRVLTEGRTLGKVVVNVIDAP
ncbi:MAG: NAD(P)-dependent alcohol dehydrogenase [Myxococcales bacterium]|nr:NAD(P)-dependent alcohol dehydrogenase [Myxococcales bacterium]